MSDESTPQDAKAMPPASAGSVSYRRRYDAAMELLWQKIGCGFLDVVAAEPAERIVEGLIDEMQAEIARLRLTDAEREAFEWAIARAIDFSSTRDEKEICTTLRGLLERLK